ncbi:MAG TPA: M3 family peptidase, partial [Candidatus Melainabacteria bacterium]|nr:M3 family peptidase [Candidatus Melainabacteria bacterium]
MNRRTFLKGSAAVVMLSGGFAMSLTKGLAETVALGPLLETWTGEHNGYPKFDLVKISDFKPSILKGMDLKREQIKAITSQKDAPTFENTIVALEDAGRPLSNATRFFGIYTSTMNDKPMQAIETEMTPLFAKFDDEIIQNDELFQRIKTVYEAREKSDLTNEQKRLVEVYYKLFTRQGAGLDADKKKRLREINEKLATLFTNFR